MKELVPVHYDFLLCRQCYLEQQKGQRMPRRDCRGGYEGVDGAVEDVPFRFDSLLTDNNDDKLYPKSTNSRVARYREYSEHIVQGGRVFARPSKNKDQQFDRLETPRTDSCASKTCV